MEKLSDKELQSLLKDWFVRSGDSFVREVKTGRLGWEDTIDSDRGYSSYFLGDASQEDVIERAYSIAKDMISIMDIPVKIVIRLSKKENCTVAGTQIFVATDVFDDKILSIDAKLDVFCGFAIHEGCHVKYTDYYAPDHNKLIHTLWNIIEDERIEQLVCQDFPGYAKYLEQTKYFMFDKLRIDRYTELEALADLPSRLVGTICRIIRYPKYLKEDDFHIFGKYLREIRKLLFTLPDTSEEAFVCATKIYEIIKELFKESEDEEGEGESGESSGEESEKSEKSDSEDPKEKSTGSEPTPDSGSDKKDGKGKSDKDIEKLLTAAVAGILREFEEKVLTPPSSELIAGCVEHSKILEDKCLGLVDECSTDKRVTYHKVSTNQTSYNESLSRVKKYVPAVSKILCGHYRDYPIVHKSLRSGILDTTKLAEAFQGVPNVYQRTGNVLTEHITVGILVDESGSMCGKKIESAKDAAILLTEALKTIKNVSFYVYGHSADTKYCGSTELYVYREKGSENKYLLGSIQARKENRDGIAIEKTALRIREFTKDHVLLFVLSDGAPAASSYHGASAIMHTKECVTKVEKMGFTVVQICISHHYDPGMMFKQYVVLEDMSSLPKDLGRVIKKSILTNSAIVVG